MKLKLLATLPLIALLAAPVHAGALGTTITEPEPQRPVVLVPPVGALGAGTIAAGAAAVLVLGALLNNNEAATTTVTQ